MESTAVSAVTESVREGSRRSRSYWIAIAVATAIAFQIAFEIPALNCFVLLYAIGLISLSRVSSARAAFRLGFLSGLLVFAPQLAWFWRIFGVASVCLWAVLSLFTGLFVFALNRWRVCFGPKWLWIVTPVVWTGFEYFRSELYFLRFSWLSVGYVFSGNSGVLPIGFIGVYGCGFVIFLIAALVLEKAQGNRVVITVAALFVIGGLVAWPKKAGSASHSGRLLRVAGMQLEFPPDLKVPEYLDQVLRLYPDTDLLVLSEYTFDGPVPMRVRDWCRSRRKYLIAGGKARAEQVGQFYNTAFVVGPDGEILFEQDKSVPIQFFKDGLPAREQNVWESPWGKIAMCVCYDMSYRRVMDRFMRQGAEALIVPFMDLTDWGEHQHVLHSRVGSIRAQEYGIPIFRLGSSGISQVISREGEIMETAPFPGQQEIMSGTLEIAGAARLPIDAVLGPVSSGVALLMLVVLVVRYSRRRVVHDGPG